MTIDEWDAPPTPEEQEITRQLLEGLKEFPLGGRMIEGKPAEEIPPWELS